MPLKCICGACRRLSGRSVSLRGLCYAVKASGADIIPGDVSRISFPAALAVFPGPGDVSSAGSILLPCPSFADRRACRFSGGL
jgi:hypothetical protein